VTPTQGRVARYVLKLRYEDVAKLAGVNKGTVKVFELRRADTKDRTVVKIRQAYERKGVRFVNNPSRQEVGVIWREYRDGGDSSD
jgi:hypothetical protein